MPDDLDELDVAALRSLVRSERAQREAAEGRIRALETKRDRQAASVKGALAVGLTPGLAPQLGLMRINARKALVVSEASKCATNLQRLADKEVAEGATGPCRDDAMPSDVRLSLNTLFFEFGGWAAARDAFNEVREVMQ